MKIRKDDDAEFRQKHVMDLRGWGFVKAGRYPGGLTDGCGLWADIFYFFLQNRKYPLSGRFWRGAFDCSCLDWLFPYFAPA